MNNNCKHITLEEIEKYVAIDEIDDSSYETDWDFSEKFQKKLDSCEVCVEMFKIYDLLAPSIGEKTFFERHCIDIDQADEHSERITQVYIFFFDTRLLQLRSSDDEDDGKPVISVYRNDKFDDYSSDYTDVIELVPEENGDIKFKVFKDLIEFTFKINLYSEYSDYILKIYSDETKELERSCPMLKDDFDESKAVAVVDDLTAGVYICRIEKEQ